MAGGQLLETSRETVCFASIMEVAGLLEARPENNGEAIGNQKDKKLLKADIVSLKHLPAFASIGGNPHGCAKWHHFPTNSALRRPVSESRVGV